MGNAFAILWLFCPVLIPLILRAMKRAWGLDIRWGGSGRVGRRRHRMPRRKAERVG
jgi:hypothetical protein